MNPLTPLLYSTYAEKFVLFGGALYAFAAVIVFFRVRYFSWLYFLVQLMMVEHIVFYHAPCLVTSSSAELIESFKMLGVVGALLMMTYGSDMGYLTLEET